MNDTIIAKIAGYHFSVPVVPLTNRSFCGATESYLQDLIFVGREIWLHSRVLLLRAPFTEIYCSVIIEKAMLKYFLQRL